MLLVSLFRAFCVVFWVFLVISVVFLACCGYGLCIFGLWLLFLVDLRLCGGVSLRVRGFYPLNIIVCCRALKWILLVL